MSGDRDNVLTEEQIEQVERQEDLNGRDAFDPEPDPEWAAEAIKEAEQEVLRRLEREPEAIRAEVRARQARDAIGDLVRLHYTQVGIKESPPNSNRVKYSLWYGMIGAWCQMYQTWLHYQNGMDFEGKFASCWHRSEDFRRRGRYFVDDSAARAGDECFFNYDHVERVLVPNYRPGYHLTGGGNTSPGDGSLSDGGAVATRMRSHAAISHYGRPDFARAGQGTDTPVEPRTLRRGDKGDDVRELQRLLNRFGHGLAEDGDFGPATLAAVQQFQSAQGLQADGVAGPLTMASLRGTQPSGSVSADKTGYINTVVPFARNCRDQYGVPVSVIVAVAILESDWGRSRLASAPYWNQFGIKVGAASPYTNGSVDMRTQEFFDPSRPVTVTGAFRAYPSLQNSVMDYGYLLRNLTRYAPAFQTSSPDEFIRAVRAAGYATDPKYAENVIAVMKTYDLYRHDDGTSPQPTTPTPGPTPTPPPGGLAGIGLRQVQQGLKRLKYNVGPVDGQNGPRTGAAISAFQRRWGLPADGVAGARTKVALVQRLLNMFGAGVPIDGQWSPATRDAVLSYQRSRGLTVDGYVGTQTWSTLCTDASPMSGMPVG